MRKLKHPALALLVLSLLFSSCAQKGATPTASSTWDTATWDHATWQ